MGVFFRMGQAGEIAKSRLAAKSAWRDISEVSFAEGDRYLLANLIDREIFLYIRRQLQLAIKETTEEEKND